MPEIMPFGKYSGSSVEQIVLRDYKYFTWAIDVVAKRSLKERFEFVEHVVSNFVSVKNCCRRECDKPANFISIYYGSMYNPGDTRVSSFDFIYCSDDCFKNDGKVSFEKANLEPLAFRTALSQTKIETNELIKIIAECMGIERNKRNSKERLEEIFNNCQLKVPYF
ncbi:hypothetical protein HY498_04250 [Candidatus Woesearchaeota archaeon]|nr:hypothetical protein [Candidatus Woesearchaeota archaeon]